MSKNKYYSSHEKNERGQSAVVVALSLGVLLLLIIGAIVLCAALFTVSTMEDYDNGGGSFGTFESQNIGSSLEELKAPTSELGVMPLQPNLSIFTGDNLKDG